MNGLTMKKTMLCRAAMVCQACLACLAMAGAASSAHAASKVALAGGGWLALDKKGLQLHDASGKTLATVAMRAKQLDLRAAGGKGLAVVLDGETQHVLALRIDLQRAELTRMPTLPTMAFGVESLCLFRDQQDFDHLFIAGKDGQAEQWLMSGATPRLVRKLSMPIDAGQCRVDDASHTLYVDEAGVGVWAYEANSEAAPARSLLKPGAHAAVKGGAARVSRSGAQRVSAGGAGRRAAAVMAPAVVVEPRAQTEPVARLGDVADDPAIWVHPGDAARSRVLGTNKKQGLMVYDMQGKEQQFLATGRLNNVDLRQGVQFGGQRVDLAVATQRDDNTVVLFGIDGEGLVAELSRFETGLDEVYGLCLFQPGSGGLELIVNDKNGVFRQYRIGRDGAAWTNTLAREFKVASQPEGCVADDRNEHLFIGEEKRGVWTLSARADHAAAPRLVLGVGKHLRADVEGMAIYHGERASYLIVSSQGDSTYVVLDAVAPYRVRGRFKVGFNLAAGIDGTADTDGLDVTSSNLGGVYAQGMLVIQDGYKRMPDGPQNFKYVSWSDVARALDL